MLLADFRTAIARELRDSTQAIFTNDDIDRALLQALEEYSRHSPVEQNTTKATTSGSRVINLDAPTFPNLIAVVAVEYPTGDYPHTRPPFEVWGTTVTLHSNNLPNGSNARIMWTQLHTVTLSASTVPAHHNEMIIAGAAGYACTNMETDVTNQLNTDPKALEHYRTIGYQYLRQFQKALDKITRKLNPHHLTTQLAPKNTKTTDFGP